MDLSKHNETFQAQSVSYERAAGRLADITFWLNSPSLQNKSEGRKTWVNEKKLCKDNRNAEIGKISTKVLRMEAVYKLAESAWDFSAKRSDYTIIKWFQG